MYIFVTLLSATFLGIYEVLKKVSLKKSNVFEVLFFYCLSAFICALLIAGNRVLELTFLDGVFILIKSLVIVFNWALVLKAMDKLDVGIVLPFGLINTILVVFASAIFFKEAIRWVHFVSLGFISVGIMLVAMVAKKDSLESKKNNYKYLWLLVIGSFLGAISGLLDKYILNVRQVNSYTFLTWFMFFNTLLYGCVYLFRNKKIEWRKLIINYPMIITGVMIALADISYYYSIVLPGAQLSLIAILRKLSVVIATVLASIFLKEKGLIKKLGILFIMLIGVAFPLLFN